MSGNVVRSRTLTFLGRRIRVEWVRNLGRRTEPSLVTMGDCDPPERPRPRIRIKSGQTPFEERETIIHELTHRAFWDLAEDSVRAFAANLNAALELLGHPAKTAE